ncbi:MAG: low-specificity L-threonine aldolase [Anaerolineales bacterium]|nr:low-specificity L-threonine aldolase [Anaerolineales bacterium]
MNTIDLRSDTVTWPTEAMRHAMATAPVGDDVYGEDPTINRLEAMAAACFGKEAALFVTSGTMGNVTSILAHCGRGDEIIAGRSSHIFVNEAGNPATLGGVHTWPLAVQPDGTLALADIEDAIRPDDPHYPRTGLVCIENTHNGAGGQPLSVEYTDTVGELAHRYGLKFHIDGARIFNAAAALDVPVDRLTQAADSVTFCLSKGLCAPVGSVIVGSHEFIYRARRIRKALGGALRQAGILAAAGIVALEEMTERLREDHANARLLAEGLASIPAITLDASTIKTNIIYFELNDAAPISADDLGVALAAEGIVIGSAYGGQKLRFVTHYWIKTAHVEHVVQRIRELLA